MADERIRVGFVGCGGISSLYTDIYASLVDVAQVVAVADMVDELAKKRQVALSEAYAVEAHRARVKASEARTEEERNHQQQKAETAETAAAVKIRKYRTHEDLLKNGFNYKGVETVLRSISKLAIVLFMIGLVTTAFAGIKAQKFKVSQHKDGHQIWFEAEDYTERLPDNDEFYPVVAKDGAFGQAITRTGNGGGRISYTFDISQADGKGGEWYFWGRVINPSNTSDFMLIESDPEDKGRIPTAAPFAAAGLGKDDRIFEQSQGPPWAWGVKPSKEAHIKTLADGKNVMHIVHRQGAPTIFWDVFCWADSKDYEPTDDDYKSAKAPAATAVDPASKLSLTWGRLKTAQ